MSYALRILSFVAKAIRRRLDTNFIITYQIIALKLKDELRKEDVITLINGMKIKFSSVKYRKWWIDSN